MRLFLFTARVFVISTMFSLFVAQNIYAHSNRHTMYTVAVGKMIVLLVLVLVVVINKLNCAVHSHAV